MYIGRTAGRFRVEKLQTRTCRLWTVLQYIYSRLLCSHYNHRQYISSDAGTVLVYVQSLVRTICILFSVLLFIVSYSFSRESFTIMLLLHFSSFVLTLLSVILHLASRSFLVFYFLCFCFCFSLYFLSFLFPSLATFCHLFPSLLFDCHLFFILSPLSIWFYFLNFCPLPNHIFLLFFLLKLRNNPK